MNKYNYPVKKESVGHLATPVCFPVSSALRFPCVPGSLRHGSGPTVVGAVAWSGVGIGGDRGGGRELVLCLRVSACGWREVREGRGAVRDRGALWWGPEEAHRAQVGR